MSDAPRLFVYGTLRSSAGNSTKLEELVTASERAHVQGLLVAQQRGPYPYLLATTKDLDSIFARMGIPKDNVVGELVTLTDDSVLERLDLFEGVVLHPEDDYPILGLREGEYKRRQLDVFTDAGTRVRAHVYIANTKNPQVTSLINGNDLVVIPSGDWSSFREKKQTGDYPTFGMETETSLLVNTEEGWKKIENVFERGRGKRYKLEFGEKRRTTRSLAPIFSQLLYSRHLGSLALPARGFYERIPRINLRHPVPWGFAYIEGNSLVDDGRDISIERLDGERAIDPSSEGITGPLIRGRSGEEDFFFEISGFPTQARRGFSSQQAREELIRRMHLADTLSGISTVRVKGRAYDEFRLIGHSSQYNVVINPFIDGINIETILEDISQETGFTSDESTTVSKLTSDTTKVLASTYGPLLSLILSGNKSDYVEFRPRHNLRVEYRNTPLQDPLSLSAGIAFFVASVVWAERKVKAYLRETVRVTHRKEVEDLDIKQLAEVYKEVRWEDAIRDTLHVRPHFSSAGTRPGYRLGEESYHGAITKDFDTTLSAYKSGQSLELELYEYAQALISDPLFRSILSEHATLDEVRVINEIIQGDITPELYSRRRNDFSREKVKRRLGGFLKRSHEDDYSWGESFPQLYTALLFSGSNSLTFQDEYHTLGIGISTNADLYIDCVPITLVLSKRNKNNNGPELEVVDRHQLDLTPRNCDHFYRTISASGPRLGPQVWEAFYTIKSDT